MLEAGSHVESAIVVVYDETVLEIAIVDVVAYLASHVEELILVGGFDIIGHLRFSSGR
jgi:hypothetical protein